MFQISKYHPDVHANPSKYISSDLVDFSIFFDDHYLYTVYHDLNSSSSNKNRYPIYKYPFHIDTQILGNMVYSLKFKFLGYELYIEANTSENSIKCMIPVSDSKVSSMMIYDRNHLFIANGKLSTSVEFVNAIYTEINNLCFNKK